MPCHLTATVTKDSSRGNRLFPPVTDDNLVGWWSFDEGSGQAVLDKSGKGHDGTLVNGPVWGVGVTDGALDLDGVNDYLRIPDSSDLGPENRDFTVEAWIKLEAMSGAHMIFHRGLSNGGCTTTQQPYWWLAIRGDVANQAEYQACGRTDLTNFGAIQDRTETNPINWTAQWTHLAAVHRVTDGPNTVTFYLNGVRHETVEIAGSSLGDVTPSGDLFIGSTLGTSNFFNGLIDEVAIYRRALSVDDLRRNCRRNDPTGTTCPNPKEPIILTPTPNQVLPPTRAYWSWRGERGVSGSLLYPTMEYELSFVDPLLGGPLLLPSSAISVNPDGSQYHVRPSLTSSASYSLTVTPIENGTPLTQFESTRLFSTDNSAVAWWRFDDNINSGPNFGFADDSISGGPNVGTLRNFNFTNISGWISEGDPCNDLVGDTLLGEGLCFDGWNDVVSFGDILDGMSQLTVEARLKTTDTWGFIVNKYLTGPDSSYMLYLYDGRGYFLTTTSSGSIGTMSGPVNDGSWHHLFGTYDGVNQSIFVDGGLKEAEAQSGAIQNNTRPLCIGAECDMSTPPVTSDPFLGLLDEVLIYNRGLAGLEVLNKYCADEALAGTDPLPAVCLD